MLALVLLFLAPYAWERAWQRLRVCYTIEGVRVVSTEAEARAVVSPARRRYEGGKLHHLAGRSLEIFGWPLVRVGDRIEDFWPRLRRLDPGWAGQFLVGRGAFDLLHNTEHIFQRSIDDEEHENWTGRTLLIGADKGRVTWILCVGDLSDCEPEPEWFAKSWWTTDRPPRPGIDYSNFGLPSGDSQTRR